MFERVLWAERVPVSDRERDLAAGRIAAAQVDGRITADKASDLRTRIGGARRRAELRAALDGLSSTPSPSWLPLATRVAAAVWLATNAVEILVWAVVSLLTRTWDDPWWIWTLVGGGAIVAGLWKTGEWEYRMLLTDAPVSSR